MATVPFETDDALLSKLVRACVEADDLDAAKAFAEQSLHGIDSIQCRLCRAPLLPGRTSTARVKRKCTLALTCAWCRSKNGATLKVTFDKKLKRRKKHLEEENRDTLTLSKDAPGVKPLARMTTSQTSSRPMNTGKKQPKTDTSFQKNTIAPSSTVPHSFKQRTLAQSAHSVQKKVDPTKPLTLLENAEQRAREEKKRKKQAAKSATGEDKQTASGTNGNNTSKPTSSSSSSSSSLANIAKLLSS